MVAKEKKHSFQEQDREVKEEHITDESREFQENLKKKEKKLHIT